MTSDADDHFGLHSGFKRRVTQSRLGDMGSEEKPLGGVPCQVCREISPASPPGGEVDATCQQC